MLASVFTMTVEWPNWWFDLNVRWVYIANIDLDLAWLAYLNSYQYIIKFLVLLVLPFGIFCVYRVRDLVDGWLWFSRLTFATMS